MRAASMEAMSWSSSWGDCSPSGLDKCLLLAHGVVSKGERVYPLRARQVPPLLPVVEWTMVPLCVI